jgi:hypothetical protein
MAERSPARAAPAFPALPAMPAPSSVGMDALPAEPASPAKAPRQPRRSPRTPPSIERQSTPLMMRDASRRSSTSRVCACTLRSITSRPRSSLAWSLWIRCGRVLTLHRGPRHRIVVDGQLASRDTARSEYTLAGRPARIGTPTRPRATPVARCVHAERPRSRKPGRLPSGPRQVS